MLLLDFLVDGSDGLGEAEAGAEVGAGRDRDKGFPSPACHIGLDSCEPLRCRCRRDGFSCSASIH